MSHTAERVEMIRLLKELQLPDESPGSTILRALKALRALPGVERVRDEWCKEYTTLRETMGFELSAARHEIEIADGEIERLRTLQHGETP